MNSLNITYLSQRVDDVSGIGRVVRALAEQMHHRGHHVSCVSQTCENSRLSWHRIARSHASNALDKLLFRVQEPLVSRNLACDVRHSMGVGRSADIVSAQSCHKAAVELARLVSASRLRSRNWGLFDRLSLQDERRLMLAESTRVIVAVSRLVRAQLLNHYSIDPDKVVVIPNGVDASGYATLPGNAARNGWREARGVRPSETVLLFVGNEFDRKGLQTIIEALPLLRDLPLVVLVAGDDDPGPYSALAQRLNVAPRVRFLGRVQEVRRTFGIADLFVLPTRYEPFGLVIAEAMAAGVPVITSRHAGAVEDMVDGQHGLFIEDPFSASELAASIRQVVTDPGLRMRLAENSLRAAKRFDWVTIADSFEELYYRVQGETV